FGCKGTGTLVGRMEKERHDPFRNVLGRKGAETLCIRSQIFVISNSVGRYYQSKYQPKPRILRKYSFKVLFYKPFGEHFRRTVFLFLPVLLQRHKNFRLPFPFIPTVHGVIVEKFDRGGFYGKLVPLGIFIKGEPSPIRCSITSVVYRLNTHSTRIFLKLH